MDNVYERMKKLGHINLGQVFTPPHLADLASTVLNIKEDDVVLDSTAGSGSLLIGCVDKGCRNVLAIEKDETLIETLKSNLRSLSVKYDVLNIGADTQKASDWIKQHKPTKAILNPPYEKKYGTFEILMNTLRALEPGTPVVLFYPRNHLEQISEEFKKENTLEKLIELPDKSFTPFASVQTSLFVIQAGIPQNGKTFKAWKMTNDGLTRKKGTYRQDTKGKWASEIFPHWVGVLAGNETDESEVEVDPSEHLSYYKYVDTRPTEEDFQNAIDQYWDWKITTAMKAAGFDESDIKVLALTQLVGQNNIFPFMDGKIELPKKKGGGQI